MDRRYVGIDLHRRRSVIYAMDADGRAVVLRTDRRTIRCGCSRSSARPATGAEVVIEATYGWYWAVDLLQEAGFSVHLAHPSGNDWGKRRVKNDERDAPRPGGLVASRSPARRRGSRRRRSARLASWSVIERGWCSCVRGLKAQVHAVMAKEGVLPGVDATCSARRARRCSTRWNSPTRTLVRVESLRDLIEVYDREVGMLERQHPRTVARRPRLPSHPGARRGRAAPSRAIFVTEIGDIGRFRSPEALCSWAGLTPRHRESDTKVVRGKITKQGSKLVRWAALEAIVRYHGGPPLA